MNVKTKWFVFLPLSFISNVYAEVIVDGSLGGGSQVVTGPKHVINEGLGARQGANLFHSFSQFNINAGEEAHFTTNNPTQNILARVTGGQSSLIDGKIVSNSSANLWFMNPAGWVVGSNASFDVNGGFHLSSASGIGFKNGGMFFADPNSESVLSVAEPIDYQFKAGKQATITFDNATVVMKDGKDISVVGGDIKMHNSFISVPGGRLLLASNSGQGQWNLDDSGLTQIRGSRGIIDITNDIDPSAVGLNENDREIRATIFRPSLTNSNDEREISAGSMQLFAHKINFKNAVIVSQSFDNDNAGPTQLQADSIHFNKSQLHNDARGSKNAGNVHITAGNLTLENQSQINTGTGLLATGLGGDIFLNLKEQLTMLNESSIVSFAHGQSAGNIQLQAGGIKMDNSTLSVTTTADGHAGNLNIKTNQLSLTNDATLDASAVVGAGHGGDLTVEADNILLSNKGHITASSGENGDTGNINIKTNNLTLLDNSKIDAINKGTGKTGSINIDSNGLIKVQNNSRINTLASNADGGTININSQGLALQQSQIVTSAEGSQGNGGNIAINTDTLITSGGFIQANTAAAGASGGDIQVNAKTTLASQNGILVGGNARQKFSPNSSLNVIQAAAPEGVSGQVDVSTVELNIAGLLAKIDSNFMTNKTIANNPCNVARDEEMSSLIETGHGGLPVKASDSVNLPLHRHIPQNKAQPQSKLYSADQKLAFLSAQDVCKQELN